MKVKIKKLNENAVIPMYSRKGDAALDLTATSKVYDEYGNVEYGTGLAVEIPKGYVGLLFPRSSNAKQFLLLSNSVGVIDSNYRGEIIVKFKPSVALFSTCFTNDARETTLNNCEVQIPLNKRFTHYNIGDRVAQLIIMPYPEVEFVEVDELSSTERGERGFGSSGK